MKKPTVSCYRIFFYLSILIFCFGMPSPAVSSEEKIDNSILEKVYTNKRKGDYHQLVKNRLIRDHNILIRGKMKSLWERRFLVHSETFTISNRSPLLTGQIFL